MGGRVTDLEELMATLVNASTNSDTVYVSEFAEAVLTLRAELKQLEAEVSRLGVVTSTAIGDQAGSEGLLSDIESQQAPAHHLEA